MKKQHLLPAFVLLAALAPATSSAQVLGLNFAATDPSDAAATLLPTETAGYYPQNNWNNLTGATGTGVGGLVVRNANGTSTPSSATVTWTSPNTWRSVDAATTGGNNAFPPGPDRKLLTGYLDTTDQTAGAAVVTVNNIDASLRTLKYDVLVYFVSDSNANRGGSYVVNDGTTSVTRWGSTMGSPSAYVEDPGTDQNLSVDGNVMRIPGLSGANFTLTANASLSNPNGFRAPINAIQIVPWNGDADGNGSTNLLDYDLIRLNMEKATASRFTGGDLTGDAFVNLNDFRMWSRVANPSDLAAALGVPEPSTVALAGLGALALLRRRRRVACGVAVVMVAAMLAAPNAQAAVTMAYTATAPTPGGPDQFSLTDDATVPGGTAPGDGVTAGGTLNSQAFSDNNGPPGQTFTTPAGGTSYAMNALWLKGGSSGSANFGGVFVATTTWSIRISRVEGVNLVPIGYSTGIPTVISDGTAAQADGDEWYSWTFSGADIKNLAPNTQYAFDIFSSAGYLGFDAAASNAGYAGGQAFNSGGGAARSFAGTNTGNLANHNYDRTFVVDLEASASAPNTATVGPADVNADGVTDIADFNIIRDNFFGTARHRSLGDLSYNGTVNLTDYLLWRNAVPASVAAQAVIPEPASATLALLSLAGLADLIRRRRRNG
jgi:hypothetical protein